MSLKKRGEYDEQYLEISSFVNVSASDQDQGSSIVRDFVSSGVLALPEQELIFEQSSDLDKGKDAELDGGQDINVGLEDEGKALTDILSVDDQIEERRDSMHSQALEEQKEAFLQEQKKANDALLLRQKDLESAFAEKVAAQKAEAEALLARQREMVDQELVLYKEEQFKFIDSEKQKVLDEASQKGILQGIEKVKMEMKESFDDFLAVINDLKAEKDRLIQAAEKPLLELSVKIAEKIIQTEISSNESTLNHILKEALLRVTEKDHVTIRVNPKEIKNVSDFKDFFEKDLKGFKQLSIAEDAKIKPGGCLVETSLGFIDSSISTKLDVILKALIAAYEQRLISNE